MQTNQSPSQRTPGGKNSGNQTNKPARSKIEIRANAKVYDVNDDAYELKLEVRLFLNGEAMGNKEIVLKDGVDPVANQFTDITGTCVLISQGSKQKDEQTLNLRVCLTDLADEKAVAIKIPAIKKVVLTEKKFAVKYVIVPDVKKRLCQINFECKVSEDGKPFKQVGVTFKKGLAQLGTGMTDNNGQATFTDTISFNEVEKIETYRFGLVGFSDEEEVNVTIPASEPKKKEDNDPEKLELMSHSDGHGNFRVKARITKSHGYAYKGAFSIWSNGQYTKHKTNTLGEYIFDLPSVLCAGEEQQIIAAVPGIADQAKITVRRRKPLIPNFAMKWRNRAWIVALGLWFLAILLGPGKALLNPDIFREKGLSASERFYNESAGIEVIAPNTITFGSNLIDYSQKFIWLAATILTILAIILTIKALIYILLYRGEEALESILHKSHGKADDPEFEKLAKYFGSYHAVSRRPATVQVGQVVSDNAEVTDANVSGSSKTAGHKERSLRDSVLTFVGIDLMLEMVLAILKKMFVK